MCLSNADRTPLARTPKRKLVDDVPSGSGTNSVQKRCHTVDTGAEQTGECEEPYLAVLESFAAADTPLSEDVGDRVGGDDTLSDVSDLTDLGTLEE